MEGDVVRIGIIICVGILSGLLAKSVHFPGGAVVGSMVGASLTAIAIPGTFAVPGSVSVAIQIILGVSLGMSFDRTILPLLGSIFPVAIMSTVVLLAVSIAMAYVAQRMGIVDFSTALFGFAPGGMSGMSLLAQAEGFQASVVAFFHTIRVFTLFLIVPIVSRLVLMKIQGQ